MLRWLGAGLILASAFLMRRTLLETERRAQRIRRALAGALETMEAEVRLLLTPMPALLRRTYDTEEGLFFERASRELSRGGSLEDAWAHAAMALPLPPDERWNFAGLGGRLGGSEESVCAALTLAASQLRRRYDERDEQRPQAERLTTALCLSAGLLLSILLA